MLTPRGCRRHEKRAAAPRRPKLRSLNTHSPRRYYRQKNQRLAPTATFLCACPVGVSPCIFVSLVASFLAFARFPFGDGPRSDARRQRRTALHPQHTHATPVPFMKQPRVGGPARTRQRCRLPPAVAPSQRKPPKPAICFITDRLSLKKVKKWTFRGP
jgi:hypothetical protein